MDTRERFSFSGQDVDLEVEFPEEYSILVEFPEPALDSAPERPRARRVGRGRRVPVRDYANKVAEEVEQRSKGAIIAAMRTIQEMAIQTDIMRQGIPGGSQPRAIKVKFGVNFDIEVGAILARTGTASSLEIELEWARHSDDILRVLRAETDVEQALSASAPPAGSEQIEAD